ncbi:hypothetical protein LMG29542_05049 [Paraburkholderia humisilvae]|uniref:Uncharacterized protein n=1 Tax=Paraburkholderia humisilvae TaxID=627669 RepID=A0A6J5EHD2_9BURK|nr:hypothetical protein LMG29542_05049 [Paraburkholderia humisilvae]
MAHAKHSASAPTLHLRYRSPATRDVNTEDRAGTAIPAQAVVNQPSTFARGNSGVRDQASPSPSAMSAINSAASDSSSARSASIDIVAGIASTALTPN